MNGQWKECAKCEKPFIAFDTKAIYCGKECRQAADRLRKGILPMDTIIEKTCDHCGTKFQSPPDKTLYCSVKCRQKAHYKRHNAPPPPKRCEQCGTEFQAKRKDAKTCSKRCRDRLREGRLKAKGVCYRCGITELPDGYDNAICVDCLQKFRNDHDQRLGRTEEERAALDEERPKTEWELWQEGIAEDEAFIKRQAEDIERFNAMMRGWPSSLHIADAMSWKREMPLPKNLQDRG